ncbi:MAG: flippase [Candidatus Aenigmarchaeota archaeon]|nr:flippase [Candidatus Aenigmarchaeota archaeon]
MADYMKRVVSGAAFLFVFNVFGAGFSYLLRFLMTSNLTPTDYALFWSCFSLISLLMIFSDFGLMHSQIYHVSKFRAEKKYPELRSAIATGFAMQLVLGVIFASIVILFSGQIASSYLSQYPNYELSVFLIRVLALGAFMNVFLNVLVSVFQGMQRMRTTAIFEFTRLFLWFSLTGVFLYFGFSTASPAFGFLAGYILMTFIYAVPAMKLIPKGKFQVDPKIARQLYTYGLPVMVSLAIGYIINYTDTIMLNVFRMTPASIGFYQTAQPTATLLWFFSGALITVLFPMIAEMNAKDKTAISQGLNLIYRYIWLAVVPAALITFSFSAEILGIIFGPAYAAGSNVLKILSIGAIMFSVTQINGAVLNGLGKPDGYRDVVFRGAIINVILNMMLIPVFGIEGAALSTLFCYSVILVGSFYELRKSVKPKIPVKSWLKTLLAGSVALGALYLAKGLAYPSVYLKIIAGFAVFGAVYGILALLMGLITIEEILDLAKKAVSK